MKVLKVFKISHSFRVLMCNLLNKLFCWIIRIIFHEILLFLCTFRDLPANQYNYQLYHIEWEDQTINKLKWWLGTDFHTILMYSQIISLEMSKRVFLFFYYYHKLSLKTIDILWRQFHIDPHQHHQQKPINSEHTWNASQNPQSLHCTTK